MKLNVASMIEQNYVVVKAVEGNPYREGTNRFNRFAAYKNGKSVAAVLADDRVRRDGFRFDVNTGLIRVVRRAARKSS